MGDFTIHPHAARRWAERVFGIPPQEVTDGDMMRAFAAVALAMESAACVVRYPGSKRRIFVTPDHVHMLVAPGRVVISTMDPAWVMRGCPCEGCLQKRAAQLKEGHVDQARHGVLSRLAGLKSGNHRARRHPPRKG